MTTTIPSNYDQNQVNIISHSNSNNNNINNKTNHNCQIHNPENTNVLTTNNHNPNNVINGYLYKPNYVLGEGAVAAAGEV